MIIVGVISWLTISGCLQVTQILDCCRELGQQAGEVYQPKLLFCVVQKRHHTRLFAASDRDADKTGNLPAGVYCTFPQ